MRPLSRRRALLCGAVALASPALVFAQAYPSKPIRIVDPWPPGSGAEPAIRIVAKKLGEILGQAVFIESKAGASGTIGSAAVAREAPDGYTLVFGNSASHGSSKAVFPTLSYDPAADFQPISLIYQNLLVVAAGKDFPANSIPELVRHAKANPGKLSYGTPGLGTPHQLAGETLKSRAGIDILHVPFKGGGMVMNALLGGSIDIAMSALAAAREMQKAGRIKILGVLAEHRIDTLPDVPAVAEFYPGINISGWSGLFGPKNLPRDMVVRLNAAVRQILDSQDVKAVLAPVGLVVSPSTPEALGKLVRDENERWQQIVRSGVKVTE